MDHVSVVEAAQDVEDGVTLADVCEELVAEAFALAGTPDKARDVDYVDCSGDCALRLADIAQYLKALIRYIGRSEIRLYRTEREIGTLGFTRADTVEKGGFTYVRQSYYSAFKRHCFFVFVGANLGNNPHIRLMKLTMRLQALIGLILFAAFPGAAQNVAFWNVENFFEDSPHFNDKARAIAKVVMALADSTGAPPDLVGLCEVENAACLRRLVAQPALRKYGYRFVHYDSPDHRGIDCALLWRGKPPVNSCAIPVRDSSGSILPTRALLLAEFDSIAIIVCHLPSKRGGSAEADRRRLLALAALSRVCDSVRTGTPDRLLIALGDFNDVRTAASDSVMAPMLELSPADDGPAPFAPGTIKFQGRWEQIDRAFISPAATATLRIAALPFLQEPDKRFGGVKPRRTFIGPRYNGGLSDHLPIMITLPSSRRRK